MRTEEKAVDTNKSGLHAKRAPEASGIKNGLPSERIFYGVLIIIGIVILTATVITGRGLCLQRVRESFSVSVKYLREQCREYDSQGKQSINNYYSSVQRLLAADKNILPGGTVVITDGDRIILSDISGAPENKSDVAELGLIDKKAKPERLTRISADSGAYYGGKAEYREYGIYLYYPADSVFSDCFNMVLLVCFIYMLIVFCMITLHERSKRQHVREINEQYEIIRSISRMFLYNVFVDLKRSRFRFLTKAADFDSIDETRPATEVLETDFTDYAAEPYRSGYRAFCDTKTLARRLEGKPYIEIEYQNIHGEWYNDIIIPKRNGEDESFDSFLIVTKNINEQKTLETEYQRKLEAAVQSEMKANEEKTALLHRMSHDLRTPINAILGMLEIAERNAGDAEK